VSRHEKRYSPLLDPPDAKTASLDAAARALVDQEPPIMAEGTAPPAP
jgi:hypothetical protein